MTLPVGWQETDPGFFYEHELGPVVYASASSFLGTGRRGSKWRANLAKRGGRMLEEIFTSKEAAMEAAVPTIRAPEYGNVPWAEDGTVGAWRFKEGDAFKKGDLLVEVEDNRAVAELRAVEDGLLVKILAPERTIVSSEQTLAFWEPERRTIDSIEERLK